MATKPTDAKGPGLPGPRLTVTLKSQLPRLLDRMQVLPTSPDAETITNAIGFAIEHWDQYLPEIQKLHVVSLSAFVSQLEESAGANAALARDFALQASKRRARRPANIDRWIDMQLTADPSVKSPELWSRAPLFVKDYFEFDRFGKAVTAARKRRM